MSHRCDSSISRRKVVSAMGAGTLGAALAGCVGLGDDPGDGEVVGVPDDADLSDSLQVWSLGTQPDGLEVVAQQYVEETGDDVDIQIDELGHDELHDSQQAAVAAGDGGPDIGAYEGRWTNQLVGTGGLVDLEDEIDAETEDAMVDWTWDRLSDDTGDGRYGIPIDIAPVVTFYNREIYDDLGISPDDIETYDDVIEYADELPDDTYWMGMGSGVLEWRWEMLVRQQGGEVYDEEGRLMINTEETRRAAEIIKELYETDTAVDEEEFTEPWTTGLAGNQIATVTSGAWMAGALIDTVPDMEGQWGIHLPPAVTEGGGRATNHGGSNLVIPNHKDDETIARAWDFLEFALTNEEQVMTIAEEAGIFPPLETVYDDEWWEQEQEFFGGDTYEPIVDIAADVPTMRMTADHREVYERMGDFIADYVVDEYDSAEEMAEDAEETLASDLNREIA
ncbi:multiple sugar transport system substrate-binding protein [Natronobacterium texcoconense]|uniref:Multiple sugar transport system substrate-binding protein n=2 Tax=Natronobacterium texcoconense TaxID=1095778 RepID=A0A1H1FRS0_NATTX|nr:multiple sugar transport system substrate-binding protein [Natronobacterium texcoconense]